jgi:hypothetical protein
VDSISDVLKQRYAALPAMGKVWLDPGLKELVLPFNRRGDSSVTSVVTKGSRYPMGGADVIRLFVHWTGKDVDLSILLLGAGMEALGQVSFTNLKQHGCVHSGDVRSAPEGASEFIDFEVGNLLEQDVRYVVASVLSFTGGPFSGFPCFAGIMERDSLKSGLKFEPDSVTLKFEISGDTTSCMPLFFDLEERKLIYADIVCGRGNARHVLGEAARLTSQVRSVLDMPRLKVTAWDVLSEHVAARGQPVVDLAQADTAYHALTTDLFMVAGLMD